MSQDDQEQKQKRYLLVKKVMVELMEHITSRPKAAIAQYLKTQVKALNKKLGDENVTEASLLNEFTEGRGRNCMHFAAARGEVDIFQALAAAGGELLRTDSEGNTVLMIAIQHNHLDLVNSLLTSEPFLAETPRNGNVYPIHLAATGGKAQIMKVLLDKKVKLNRISDELGGVLQWAVMHQDEEVLNMLISNGADVMIHGACTKTMPGCFILALDSGNKKLIDALFQADKRVLEQKDPLGWGCVHLMCEQGKLETLKWLVEQGADLYMEREGVNGMDLALKEKQFEVVAYLRHITNGKLQHSEQMKAQQQKEEEQQQKEEAQKKEVSEEAKAEAVAIKDEANKHFLNKEYEQAIVLYGQALEKDHRNIQVLTNRAASYINIGQCDKALEDCKVARGVSLDWPKTYFREGEAYFQLKNYPDAAASFWEALRLEPTNKAYKTGFDKSVAAGKAFYGTK